MKLVLLSLAAAFVINTVVLAQEQHSMDAHLKPFGICKPITQRVNEQDGCWIVSDTPLGKMSASKVFWHLDQYPTQATAEAAKGPGSSILFAHGHWWLLTVGDPDWRPSSKGVHVADIGPLQVDAGTEYSALYLDATMDSHTKSAIHRHSGPEAWYTLTGESCLETPSGKQVGKAGGDPLFLPEGTLMQLTASGGQKRRAITLILHRSAEPPTTVIDTWQPKGLCE